MPRDHEAERVQAAMRAERIARGIEDERPPIISTPTTNGNGKKWWRETWGKAVGSALGVLLLALLTFVASGKAYEIYGLPPRVERLESLAQRPPSPASLPPEQVELMRRLTAALEKRNR